MLRFFRANRLSQLFGLLVLLLLVRLPAYLGDVPLLIPELQWMLLGEQLAQGRLLYADVWDSTAPLSALVYASLHVLFGRSQAALQGAAWVVAAAQSIYFTTLLNRRGAFPDRTYLPGLLYLVLLNASLDCATLSPPLMATQFLLLALSSLLKQLDREGATDEVFEIGFYISLATLFHPPMIVFILWVFVSLLLYSGASVRQHSLALFGFLFPLLFTALYFYLNGTFEAFQRNFLSAVFQLRQYNLNEFGSLILALTLPVLIAGLGFFRLINYGRFTNYQTRVQQIMVFWTLAAVLSVGLMPFLAPMQFVVFAPPVAFFSVYFFTSFRRAWVPEAVFLVFFGVVLLLQYQAVYPIFGRRLASLDALRIKPVQLPGAVQQKRILVLGNDPGAYLGNAPATAYLNWSLARHDFEQLNRFENVANVLKQFERDPPEYLIDPRNLAPRLFARIPALGRQYTEVGRGVYQRMSMTNDQ
jgi:hypothetical protein